MSKILNSEVIKPDDIKHLEVIKATSSIREAVATLEQQLGQLPGAQAYETLKEGLHTIETNFNAHFSALQSIPDYQPIIEPIKNEIYVLKQQLKDLSYALNKKEYKPNITVNAPEPDLSELDDLLSLPDQIQEMLDDLDVMPAEELKKYFKKILDLLEAISKKSYNVIAGGGQSSVYQAIDIATGRLVSVYAVESADSPGVFGVLALNADGTPVGSGGGTVETFYRTTDTGDIRVTSDGSIRTYAT